MHKFKAFMVILIFFAIWGVCIGTTGGLGIIFGWLPAFVFLFILAMFD